MRDGESGSASRNTMIGGGLLSLIAILAIGTALYLRSRPPAVEPTAAVEAPAPAAPAPAPTPAPAVESPPAAPTPLPATVAPRKASPRKVTEPPPVLAAKSPVHASLTIDSDVPGASVFIDRTFVGNTPLQLERLEPGQRTINLSADGFSTITHSMELVAGANEVTLRFKEVKLDSHVPVVHKHGIGSCDGTLVATVEGLSYVTSNKGDAFALPFDQMEAFAVDYQQKNLRVKQKSGKTWNFTDKTANGDALLVFHREVDAARKKLAEGYAPVK